MPSVIAANSAVSAVQIAKARMEALSNNISNKNTIAYKSSDVRSSDLFYSSLNRPYSSDGDKGIPVQAQVGHGAKINQIARMTFQGDLKSTNLPLDMMINGVGYFSVMLPEEKKKLRQEMGL